MYKTLNMCVIIAGVTDNIHNSNDRIVVPVTKAEFAVLKSAFSVRYAFQFSALSLFCYLNEGLFGIVF